MDRKKAVETILERGIRVFDNGGVTLDRYTAFVPDGRRYAVIGLSDDPFPPSGFASTAAMNPHHSLPKTKKEFPTWRSRRQNFPTTSCRPYCGTPNPIREPQIFPPRERKRRANLPHKSANMVRILQPNISQQRRFPCIWNRLPN